VKKKTILTACASVSAVALIACAALTRWDSGDGLPSVSAVSPSAPEPWSDRLDILGPEEPRTYFQYVDDRGNVRFAESLDHVPEDWHGRVGRVVLDVPPPDSPAAARMVRRLRPERANSATR
jgi:hypothetical protein